MRIYIRFFFFLFVCIPIALFPLRGWAKPLSGVLLGESELGTVEKVRCGYIGGAWVSGNLKKKVFYSHRSQVKYYQNRIKTLSKIASPSLFEEAILRNVRKLLKKFNKLLKQGDKVCAILATVPPTVLAPTGTPQEATPTVLPTETSTPAITNTVTSIPTERATATLTPSPTVTATNTSTRTATATATLTVTSTQTSTLTFTATVTPTLTATSTNTLTATPTSTLTPTSTPTPTSTLTPTSTNTPTATPTSIAYLPYVHSDGRYDFDDVAGSFQAASWPTATPTP